jgi:hypothetical protein
MNAPWVSLPLLRNDEDSMEPAASTHSPASPQGVMLCGRHSLQCLPAQDPHTWAQLGPHGLCANLKPSASAQGTLALTTPVHEPAKSGTIVTKGLLTIGCYVDCMSAGEVEEG